MSDPKIPDGIPPDRELYTVPSRSSWFQWDEVHEIEKAELGEFFDGTSYSKNPRVYKEYRDFIINRYREDPSRRLNFTEVRRSLVGDVGVLRRVFLFLDRWGLINFSAAEPSKVPASGAERGGCVFRVVVEDSPPSNVRIVPHPNAARGLPSQPSVGSKGAEDGGSFKLPPLTSYSDVFGSGAPLAERLCGNCGEVCVSGCYESKSGIAICTNCFKKDDSVGSSADDLKFIDKEYLDGGKHITNEWTDIETLSLLEAIVSKGPDWDLIAGHVRRNRLECIAKLIQLPFGEHMLGSIAGKYDQRNLVRQRTEPPAPDLVQEFVKTEMQDDGNAEEEDYTAGEVETEPPLKRRCISISDTSNSLMETVASLSALAGPHVAAAAAEAAISALCDEHPFAKKVFTNANETIDVEFSVAPEDRLVSDLKTDDEMTDEAFKAAEFTAGKNFGLLSFQIRAAIATAFGSTAAHAKLLADQEDRHIDYLMTSIISAQLRKIQCKMKHFEMLESIMEQQYTQIQKLKEEILQHWIDISQRALAAGIPSWKDPSLHKLLPNKHTTT